MRYQGMPVEERLWGRTELTGTGCWEWTGNRSPKGYGTVMHQGITRRTHRVAYELTHGPIPAGLVVMHSCDNPPCVNPDHLSVGAPRDNSADMVAKGRARALIGADNGKLKHSDDDVRAIRAASAGGESLSSIARRYGTTKNYIWLIVKRRVRTAI